jgi:hypothetical protein
MNDTSPGILDRARARVEELLSGYQRPALAVEREQEMVAFAERESRESGLAGLPGILGPEYASNRG